MKKLAAALLAATMLVSLTACGSKTETPAETPAATEEEAPAETPAEGILTMATNAQFPPYEFYEGDKVVGIDAEIAAAIAEKLGTTLEIVDMDFATIITAVQSGKADFGMAGMTVNEERLQNVNFTDSYATGVQVVIVKEDSEIASVDDLEGKLIGVQEGTTGHIYCSDDYGEENVNALADGATAVNALQQGKVDCVVIDRQPALSYVKANEGLKILDTEYVAEDYAIAVAKDNTELKDSINAALNELIEDGTVQSILDKYIKAE